MSNTVTYIGGKIPLWLRKAFCFLDATYIFIDLPEVGDGHTVDDLLVVSSTWLTYVGNLETLHGLPTDSVLLDLKRETDLSLLKEDFVADLVRDEMSTLECVTRLSKYAEARSSDPERESKELLTNLHNFGMVGKEAEVARNLLEGSLRGGAVPAKGSDELLAAVWGENGESSKVKYVMRRINSRLAERDVPVRVVNQRGVGWGFEGGHLPDYLPDAKEGGPQGEEISCEECSFGRSDTKADGLRE